MHKVHLWMQSWRKCGGLSDLLFPSGLFGGVLAKTEGWTRYLTNGSVWFWALKEMHTSKNYLLIFYGILAGLQKCKTCKRIIIADQCQSKISLKTMFRKKRNYTLEDVDLKCENCIWNLPAVANCQDCPSLLCHKCLEVSVTNRLSSFSNSMLHRKPVITFLCTTFF